MLNARLSILSGAILLLVATAVVSACGSGGPSLSEYAHELERLVADMNARLDRGTVALAEEPPSLELIRTWADDRMVARSEFLEALGALEPPKEVVELHAAATDIMMTLVTAEQQMVDEIHATDDLATLQKIWQSPSGQAARLADEKAVAICQAAQAAMDSTAERAQFAGTPWVPAELQQVVQVAFGCVAAER